MFTTRLNENCKITIFSCINFKSLQAAQPLPLLVQSRENGFPTSLSAMLPNLTKHKEFYSGQVPDREDP